MSNENSFIIVNGVLLRYTGTETEVEIPQGITEIGREGGSWPFWRREDITSVIIPEGVTRIGENAFYGCSGLKTLRLPESLKIIEDNAFYGCRALENCPIPQGVKTIGSGAFGGCSALAGEKEMLIIDGILHCCRGDLENVEIPEGVHTIGVGAFLKMAPLKSVTIPASVKRIEKNSFSGCTGLKEISLPDSVEYLGDYALSGCAALETVQLSENLLTLGRWAFQDCKSLKSISLPGKLTSIGDNVFCGCHEELRHVVIPRSITAKLPNQIAPLHTLLIPDCSFSHENQIPGSLFWGEPYYEENTKLFTVAEGDRVKCKLLINGDFAPLFDKKGNFDWQQYDLLLINNGPKRKFSPVFRTLAMLYRLRYGQDLPQQMKDSYTEHICKNVKKIAPYVNIQPEDGLVTLLETIGAIRDKNRKALMILMGLASAPAPKAKKEAADGTKTAAQLKKEWTFKKLEDGTLRLNAYKGSDVDIQVPDKIGNAGVTVLGEDCLSPDAWNASLEQKIRRMQIRSVVIPEGITRLESRLFENCRSLTQVRLPDTLQEIGNSCFRGCKALKEILLPEKAKLLSGAFWGCEGLADDRGFVICGNTLFDYFGENLCVTVPEGVTAISPSAFHGRKQIKELHLPEGIGKLPAFFLDGQTELEILTIPASVTVVDDLFRYAAPRRLKIRGFNRSAAQEYARKEGYVFESLGVLQKKTSDFVIEEGQLIQYRGNAETVEVPAGVQIVGMEAFKDNLRIRKVILPQGVREIKARAFSGCSALEEIQFPDSLANIGADAFYHTRWIRKQGKGAVYAGSVLYAWDEVPGEVTVRHGTVTLGRNVFSGKHGLQKIILPEGLKRIEFFAFSCCDSLQEMVIPASVTEIEDYALEYVSLKKVSGGVLQRKEKMSAKFKPFYLGDPRDTAWLTLYQPDKSWQKAVAQNLTDHPENVTPAMEIMAELIRSSPAEKPMGKRAAAFLEAWCSYAGREAVQSLLAALKEKKYPEAAKLESSEALLTCLADPIAEDLSLLHPVEAMVAQAIVPSPGFDKLLKQIYTGVAYADSDVLCAPRVIAFILWEYICQIDSEKAQNMSHYDHPFDLVTCRETADTAARALNREQLLDVMKKLAEVNGKEYWLPYARYAEETQTAALVRQLKDWDNWAKYGHEGRKNIFFARVGLTLNDTKAAMLHMDQSGCLESYAAMWQADADTLRDTVLSDFGFDENRQIRYDLGGNAVIISIDPDLTLSIFDTNAGKTVKSIPKKGADPALYEKAKDDFANLKKNIKKVITNRKKVLFADFLSGEEKPARKWKQAYLDNPVLHSVAKLVVWSQQGHTFVLTPEGALDSSGNAYTITEAPICVAHPVDMREELPLWQEYFTSHDLKQPFEQVWEPAYDPAEILPERYAGTRVNVYRLTNKEPHGISVWGLVDYSEDYGFTLADCKMEQKPSEWRFVHGITDDATFTLGRFSFDAYTRRVNHIVYIFDKWTVSDRIAKDDVTVAELLPSFTAAQIREFLELANQKGCTNCAALLLDYQNQNFGTFDPLAEFTLDL